MRFDRWRNRNLLVVFILYFSFSAWSQSASPRMRVEFSNPGQSPGHWVLEFTPEGKGHFHADRVATEDASLALPEIEREIELTREFAGRFFTSAREKKLFNFQCESKSKVAFQGMKAFSYSGSDGEGHCQFNYSADKRMNELAESAVALASTVIEGAKLKSLQLHDRLGLDREMGYVVDAVKDGRLQQIQVIRVDLEQLAVDEAVLARVRSRAKQLLATMVQTR